MKALAWLAIVLLVAGAFLAGQVVPRLVPQLVGPTPTPVVELRKMTVLVAQTVEVPVIVRVVETVVVPLAMTPIPSVAECVEIGAYMEAMAEIRDERSDILEDEARWHEKRSDQSPEVAKERCNEFWERWRDLGTKLSDVTTPALLRKAHDGFRQSVEETLRSLEYLQAYYQTGLESDRAKSNEALARGNRLAQEYFYEVYDLWRLCVEE